MFVKRANSSNQHSQRSKRSEETEHSNSRSRNKPRDDRDLAESVRELSICGDKRPSSHKAVSSGNQSSRSQKPAHALTRSHEQNPSRKTTAPDLLPTKPVKHSPQVPSSVTGEQTPSESGRAKRLQGRSSAASPQKAAGGASSTALKRGRKDESPTSSASGKKPKSSEASASTSYSLCGLMYGPEIGGGIGGELWALYLHRNDQDQIISNVSGEPGNYQYQEVHGAGPNHYGNDFGYNLIANIAAADRNRYPTVVRLQSLVDQFGDDPADWCYDVLNRLKHERIIPQNTNISSIYDTESIG